MFPLTLPPALLLAALLSTPTLRIIRTSLRTIGVVGIGGMPTTILVV